MALEIVKTTKETRLLQERFWASLQERKKPRRRETRSWPPERQRKKKFLKIDNLERIIKGFSCGKPVQQ